MTKLAHWRPPCFKAVIWVAGLAAAFAMTPASLQAADPPGFEAFSQAPRIDGELSDAAWTTGDWHAGFITLDAQQPAARQTAFRVGYDENYFYFAARCFHPEPETLGGETRPRDSGVYDGESVELFLGTQGRQRDYFHFVFDPAGSRYDARIDPAAQLTESAWDPDFRMATGREPGAWTIEVAIPLAELALGEVVGQPWPILVARNSGQPSSMIPLEGKFHQPDHFPLITPPDALADPFRWQYGGIREPQSQLDNGKHVYGGSVAFSNEGTRDRKVAIRVHLRQPGGNDIGEPQEFGRATVSPGDRIEAPFAVRVPEAGLWELVVDLVDASTPEPRLLARQRERVRISSESIEITFHEPFYRDSVYATEAFDGIKAEVSFLSASASPRQVDLWLRKGHEAGIELARQTVDVSGQRAVIELKMDRPEPGPYVFGVEVPGMPASAATRPVTFLRRVDHEWRIDSKLVLRRNGEPVFPLGMFQSQSSLALMREEGCNVHLQYNAATSTEEVVREWLDKSLEEGMFLIVHPYPKGREAHPEKKAEPLSAEFERGLRERVRALRDHPALMAWYLSDEPKVDPVVQQRLERIFQIMKEEDPYHPTIIVHHQTRGIDTYINACDVMMPDPYPEFKEDGLSIRPMNIVAAFVDRALEKGQRRVAVWLTPQVFNWSAWGREGQRAPHFDELRNMFYQGVSRGARGIVGWTFNHRQSQPHLALGTPAIHAELRAIEPFLLEDDADLARVRDNGGISEKHVYVTSRVVGDRIVLIAINTSEQAGRLGLNLRGTARQVPRWHVLGEARTVAGGNALSDRFDGYAVHVYASAPLDEGLASHEETRQAIEQLQQERVKPGNLLHYETGTTVSSSRRKPYSGDAWAVLNDGWAEWVGPRTWAPHPDDRTAHVEIDFNRRVAVGRLELHGVRMDDRFSLLVPDGEGGWRPHAWEQRPADSDRHHLFRFAPVEVDRLRLEIRNTGSNPPALLEIEAYPD